MKRTASSVLAAIALSCLPAVCRAQDFSADVVYVAPGKAAVASNKTPAPIHQPSKLFVSEGKMRWDQRLTDFLPDFRMSDPVANASATLRDALSHRTGIARGELVWLASGIGRDEVLHRLRFLKPESLFRTQFSYQNMLFLAAGQAVGKAAGSTWDEVVRQRIFNPLGMTSSAPTYSGVTNPNIARGHGIEHDTAFIKQPFDADNIGPAGSILSKALVAY